MRKAPGIADAHADVTAIGGYDFAAYPVAFGYAEGEFTTDGDALLRDGNHRFLFHACLLLRHLRGFGSGVVTRPHHAGAEQNDDDERAGPRHQTCRAHFHVHFISMFDGLKVMRGIEPRVSRFDSQNRRPMP